MITLLIPTLNRSDFVIRYLYFLKENAFEGRVCIGDSSNARHLEQAKVAIENLKADFDIIHREYPGFSISECIREMLPLINTPYVMYINDDDLLLPRALDECMQFLDNNPDYSAASGITVLCGIKFTATNQQITNALEAPLNIIKEDTACQRLINLLSNYTVVSHSVARTKQFMERWPFNSGFLNASFSTEFLPNCMIAVQGKIKKLDRIFVVRQIHNRRYLMPDLYNWIIDKNWYPSYQIFSDTLQQALMQADGINQQKAQQVIKQAFVAYLRSRGQREHKYRYEQKDSPRMHIRIKQKLKTIPVVSGHLLPTWRKVRDSRYRLFPTNSISLYALLSPFSPYHDDFMAAYKAVTKTLETG